jgi:small GTP-binding protein
MDSFDYLFKILLIGQPQVGKTSIVRSYVDGIFPQEHYTTIGVDFKIKTLENDNGKLVKLQIWDTAGQERFKSVTQQYFRGGKAVLLVFALDDLDSFQKIQNWITMTTEIPYRILVGNKCDLKEDLAVSKDVIDAFLIHYPDMKYIAVSAKSGESINDLFKTIANDLSRQEALNNEKQVSIKVELKEPEKNNSNKCCGTNG